jgi:hypothetical protein
MGGGETSCCQSDRERSERKGEESAIEGAREWPGSVVGMGEELGRMALM